MKEIKMVDLQGQYHKIKGEIDKTVNSTIESTAFINGPVVDDFATDLKSYLNVEHVIPCGNGTDALQISLMALELNPGDEIITTTFSFIATAEVISLLGLTPVLIDIDEKTFNIDVELIEKAITPKTKAIIPVHLFGQTADMTSVMNLAKRHKLYVIEDNCQAIGADYFTTDNKKVKAGTIGDIGCTSFFPSKNLGAFGDGGAIFTNNDELANIIKVIANHGMKKRYYHDIIGVNSRLDSIQAAILRVKLRYLDDYNNARIAVADFYDNAFSKNNNIICPNRSSFSNHVFHQYSIIIKNGKRDALKDFLASKNIPSMIYYPVSIHLQKPFVNSKFINGNLVISEEISSKILSLPIHTELDIEQLEYITSAVNEFLS